jgi:predicted nuclease with TOPRIM domain
MRQEIITDRRGYKRRVMVRDNDSDEMLEYGVPAGPPDMDSLDWERLKREINNALVDNGLFTWDDIQKSSVGLNAANTVVKRHLSGIYHEQARINKEANQK